MQEFKIGDHVKHKASGETGIIVEKNSKCIKESHLLMCPRKLMANGAGIPIAQIEKINECELVFTGTYNISVGFDKVERDVSGGLIELCVGGNSEGSSRPWDGYPPESTSDENKIFVLLCCWYEGDSNLVDDSFVCASENIDELKVRAKEMDIDAIIYLPGQAVPDKGSYGSDGRYRIVEESLIKNGKPARQIFLISGRKGSASKGMVNYFQCPECGAEHETVVSKCEKCNVHFSKKEQVISYD